MMGIATMSNQESSDLFRVAAAEMKMETAIAEKDFWVCYLLDYLFHRSEFKGSIIFKGGTSLSKAFGLIGASRKTSTSSWTGASSATA